MTGAGRSLNAKKGKSMRGIIAAERVLGKQMPRDTDGKALKYAIIAESSLSTGETIKNGTAIISAVLNAGMISKKRKYMSHATGVER